MDARLFSRLPFLMVLGLITACSQSNTSKTESKVFPATSGDCGAQVHPTKYLAEWEDGHYSVEYAPTREELLKKFVRPHLEKIKFVEQSQMVALEAQPLSEPTEPRETWGQVVTGAMTLQSQGIKGAGITVAVIDTGIETRHPQLSSQLFVNPGEIADDKVDNDGNGYVDDVSGWDFVAKSPGVTDPNGHGTHVSGILAGAEGKFPMVGVAPGAKIMPLRFMDQNGLGDLANAVLAMDYAAKMGARVINASWGGTQCFKSLDNAIKRLTAKDVLIVVAAGNDGVPLDKSPRFPAAFENDMQITVGASTYRGYTAGFSNTGHLVHLVAPGMEILSTFQVTGTTANWAWRDGTSMATPFVSGAIALLRSAYPFASAIEIKNAVVQSVRKGFCCNLSDGELDTVAAHQALSKTVSRP